MKKINMTLAVILCVAGAAFGQGSLTPPGAPGATMKTLDELDVAIAGVSNAVNAIQGEARIDVSTLAGDSNNHHIISEPGSYYLTGNLEVSKLYGIQIDAVGVTLDLNGFAIYRVSGTGGRGIQLYAEANRVTVRNGSVSGFLYGVYSFSSSPYVYGSLFENLSVSECTYASIYAGKGARVVNCMAYNNESWGIYTDAGSSVIGCTAYGNLGGGIRTGSACVVKECIVYENQENYGIQTGDGALISQCSVRGNTVDIGIYAGLGSSVNECTVTDNTAEYGIYVRLESSVNECTVRASGSSHGIYAQADCTLNGCTASDNEGVGVFVDTGSSLNYCTANKNQGSYGITANGNCSLIGCVAIGNWQGGIAADQDALLRDCSARKNGGIYGGGAFGFNVGEHSVMSGCVASENISTAYTGGGIYIGTGSSVIGCTASKNSNTNSTTSFQGFGIYAAGSCTIKDCTTYLNKGDGIRAGSDSQIIGNNCDSNGYLADGAGIHVVGYDTRIEGNNVTDNDRGIDVDQSGNFIVRNTASGNAKNWDVVANNACLVVYRTACTAISGSSGGTAPGSTDPNVNFSY